MTGAASHEHDAEFIAEALPQLAAYWGWDDADREHVRQLIEWARGVAEIAAARLRHRAELDSIRSRLRKLEALAANADEHEAAAARAGAERTRDKLKLVQGGLASD